KAAGAREYAAVQVAFEARQRHALGREVDSGLQTLRGNLRIRQGKAAVSKLEKPFDDRLAHGAGGFELEQSMRADPRLILERGCRLSVDVRMGDEIERTRVQQAGASGQLDMADGAVKGELLDADVAVRESDLRRVLLCQRQSIEVESQIRKNQISCNRGDFRPRRFYVRANRHTTLQLLGHG